MARPPRIQYPGALYHVTSRGNRRSRIYVDDRDYLIWQDRLAATVKRFNFAVHAFCQMPNHYHLLVQTAEANLSRGMHYLNSTYAQKFNWRHKLTGHVVQGRFFALLVNDDSQLLENARYFAQNPVRAELVTTPDEWRWGSHIHFCGNAPPLEFLRADWLLSKFGTLDAAHAARKYLEFVHADPHAQDPMRDHSERGLDPSAARRRLALPLAAYGNRYSNRHEAMARAFLSTAYSMGEIARHFGVSAKTVSRALAAYERNINAELVSASGCDPKVDTNPAVDDPPVLA